METQLNEIELKVLAALNKQAQDCAGGDFGYMPNVDRCGLTKHQFAGYISQLEQKGVFEYVGWGVNGETNEGGNYSIKEQHR